MYREMLLGILGGTVSGITPALHVNTLASLLDGMSIFSGFSFVIVVYAMGLTHTFLDSIPSAFFGVPDEGTALSILPAHRLVLKGRALEVISISLWASFSAILFALPLLLIYPSLAERYSPTLGRVFVLLLAVFLILTEKGIKKLHALMIFLLSGYLGITVEKFPLKEPYFHLFVGLFAVPTLIVALGSSQKKLTFDPDAEIKMKTSKFIFFSLLGSLLGMMASLLPTFTSSQAALMGSFISRDERSFLTVVFSVNTSNFIFSLVNFYLTGRTRNGIMVLLRKRHAVLTHSQMQLLVLMSLAISLVVMLYGVRLARIISRMLQGIDYKKLNLGILVFVFLASYYFDGFLGILFLTTAGMIGYLTLRLGVKRTNCMGVLMLKIILKA
ncbi:tripartite tricarboxylate transporter permease [Thermococcus sp.]